MKDFDEEIVNNDELLKIVNEINLIIKKDRHNNDSIKDLKNRLNK